MLNTSSTMDLISFKPQILDRIVPDVSLDRHLHVGIRSHGRQPEEFKPLEVLSTKSDAFTTSSYIQNGNTMIICTITYGINELSTDCDQYTSVSPTVSISRGRSGAPTDEEMNLSQQLYELVLTNKLLPVNSVKFQPKLLVDRTLENVEDNKWFKFNLFVHLKVFDRSGPLLSPCYYSLVKCLQQVQLPQIYVEDSFGGGANTFSKLTTENLKVYEETLPLELNLQNFPMASGFGIYELDGENIVLCDVENESEEVNVLTRGHVIGTGDKMTYFSLVNGGLLDVSRDELKEMISRSSSRAAQSLT